MRVLKLILLGLFSFSAPGLYYFQAKKLSEANHNLVKHKYEIQIESLKYEIKLKQKIDSVEKKAAQKTLPLPRQSKAQAKDLFKILRKILEIENAIALANLSYWSMEKRSLPTPLLANTTSFLNETKQDVVKNASIIPDYDDFEKSLLKSRNEISELMKEYINNEELKQQLEKIREGIQELESDILLTVMTKATKF